MWPLEANANIYNFSRFMLASVRVRDGFKVHYTFMVKESFPKFFSLANNKTESMISCLPNEDEICVHSQPEQCHFQVLISLTCMSMKIHDLHQYEHSIQTHKLQKNSEKLDLRGVAESCKTIRLWAQPHVLHCVQNPFLPHSLMWTSCFYLPP